MGTPTVSEWVDFMPDSVTLTPCTGRNGDGSPNYNDAGAYTLQCRIEMRNRLVVNRHGQTVTARGRVFTIATTAPGIDDKVTLPANYVPRTPPVIAINPVSDENDTHHVTIEFG